MIHLNKLDFADTLAAHPRSVVIFSASWCGPCQHLKKNLIRKLPNLDQVFVVDVDESPELTAEHRIRSVPTALFFEGIHLADSTSGVDAVKPIIAFLEDA